MSKQKAEITFEGAGIVDRVDSFTSKAGKEIITLVLKTEGQYPQLCPIKCFGRMVDTAKELKPGMLVAVSGRVGGRDWNGKVYGDNVAETIEVVGGGEKDEAPQVPPPGAEEEPPF